MWGKKKYKQIDIPSLIQQPPVFQPLTPVQQVPLTLEQAEQQVNELRKKIDSEKEEINNKEFLLEMEQWKDKIETYLKNKFFEIDMRLSTLE